ncbi:hypothetical protein ON010_g16251 [Phytophthora cinnamomi]|nr:hypothetical protein ON010_g16251 [Phytophthora cinnamomi]
MSTSQNGNNAVELTPNHIVHNPLKEETARNVSNVEAHVVSKRKQHELAIQVQQHRLSLADRFMVQVAPKAEEKHQAPPKFSEPAVQPTKRQKTWWKSLVTRRTDFGATAANIAPQSSGTEADGGSHANAVVDVKMGTQC